MYSPRPFRRCIWICMTTIRSKGPVSAVCPKRTGPHLWAILKLDIIFMLKSIGYNEFTKYVETWRETAVIGQQLQQHHNEQLQLEQTSCRKISLLCSLVFIRSISSILSAQQTQRLKKPYWNSLLRSSLTWWVSLTQSHWVLAQIWRCINVLFREFRKRKLDGQELQRIGLNQEQHSLDNNPIDILYRFSKKSQRSELKIQHNAAPWLQLTIRFL